MFDRPWWWNWQTHHLEGVAPQGVRVRIPPRAPSIESTTTRRELEWQSSGLLTRKVRVQVPGGAPISRRRVNAGAVPFTAPMVESADTPVSEAGGRKVVRVQVSLGAPHTASSNSSAVERRHDMAKAGGSTPSSRTTHMCDRRAGQRWLASSWSTSNFALVAELADARDSKPRAARHVGSTPTERTNDFHGCLAEWSKAPGLKPGKGKPFAGSNPRSILHPLFSISSECGAVR